MHVLDREETFDLLPYGRTADAIEKVLEAHAAGIAAAPERAVVPLAGEDSLLVMPARDDAIAMTKLVTVHPDNAGRGLPVVQGVVVVLDARTGERLALLDGAAVTARRTPAVSLLAARRLAPRPDGPLWIVGAGTQGRAHLEAFSEEFGTRRVFVTSRSAHSTDALVRHARELGLDAEGAPDPQGPLRSATMIVTATSSAMPVIPAGVRPDAFVAAVGAYRPDMRELPADLVRAATVFVDTLEGARAEAGDLIHGLTDWSRVRTLLDALALPNPAPDPEAGPVVFKSVGHALWDLGAARLAVEALRLR